MKILWITNIPSPYRVDFFNQLGQRVDLEVIFERESSSERDSSWKDHDFKNFNTIFLKGKHIGVDFSLSFEILEYIKKNKYDHIVVTNFASPTGILGILKMIILKIPYIIESDGGFPKKNNFITRLIKYITLTKAKKCLSTSITHDDYYMSNGVLKENIIRYPFSSVIEKDIVGKNEYTSVDSIKNKKEIGIDTNLMILSVGRFIESKGFEDLLIAFSHFPDDYSITLCIIGGEITPTYKKLIEEKNIKNVRIVKFQSKDNLKKYYLASDIFVLPTHYDIWGLVINEAFANGLPIITTNKCLAGIEMIEEGKNGFIIDPQDTVTLYKKMKELIDNESLRRNMSRENIDKSEEYTIEQMVSFHSKFFKEISKWR